MNNNLNDMKEGGLMSQWYNFDKINQHESDFKIIFGSR